MYDSKAVAKFNEIQSEILRLGWDTVSMMYHPDVNIDQPEAFKVFQLYREIYESMKSRLTVTLD